MTLFYQPQQYKCSAPAWTTCAFQILPPPLMDKMSLIGLYAIKETSLELSL